jgi:hypothetical protein
MNLYCHRAEFYDIIEVLNGFLAPGTWFFCLGQSNVALMISIRRSNGVVFLWFGEVRIRAPG